MISGFVVGAIYRNNKGYRFRIVAVEPSHINADQFDQVDYVWLGRADGRVHQFLANATKHHEYRREQYVIDELPV